jgi:hypothetical protein
MEETKLYVKTYLVAEAPVETGYTFFTLYPWLIPAIVSLITLLSILFFISNRIFKFNDINKKF